MVLSDEPGRAPSTPSPTPTPVPPSDTPLDYTMKTPQLERTSRLCMDPSLEAMLILNNMHTRQSASPTNDLLSPPPACSNAAKSHPFLNTSPQITQSQLKSTINSSDKAGRAGRDKEVDNNRGLEVFDSLQKDGCSFSHPPKNSSNAAKSHPILNTSPRKPKSQLKLTNNSSDKAGGDKEVDNNCGLEAFDSLQKDGGCSFSHPPNSSNAAKSNAGVLNTSPRKP
jgi:hypothetical protein